MYEHFCVVGRAILDLFFHGFLLYGFVSHFMRASSILYSSTWTFVLISRFGEILSLMESSVSLRPLFA
jgi:hypothetical protein